jgi:hypothetical protein
MLTRDPETQMTFSRHAVIALALAILCRAPSAHALEKAAPVPADPGPAPWDGAPSCKVSYYNICNGYVKAQWPLQYGERVGVSFGACCPEAVLAGTSHYVMWPQPTGYGYTGSVDVFEADGQDCPTGPALASQPFVPTGFYQWYTLAWSVPVPDRFVVVVNAGSRDPASPSTLGLASDVPEAIPYGNGFPEACGLCYPATRENRSYSWGVPSNPLCPGEPFPGETTCAPQLLWTARLLCPVPVERMSWGRIKALYD